MPFNQNAAIVGIVGDDGVTVADVATFAGVDRLRVEAILAGGIGLVSDADDNSIASGQTTLLTIPIPYVFDGTVWRRTQGRAYSGAIDEALIHQLVRAALAGRDSSAGAGSQEAPIEARNADADADWGDTLLGLLANARLGVFDERASTYRRLPGITPAASADLSPGAYVVEPRQDAFPATVQGRRFYVTNGINSPVVAQASFVNTTPTLLLQQAASTKKVILRSISIVLTNAPTNNPVRVFVALDTGDRLVSGGTARTPRNINEESATASAITAWLENPTVTAPGAGERPLLHHAILNSEGQGATILFRDGIFLGTTSSLLVYVFGTGGATPPNIFYTAEWEEVTA